MTDRFNMRRFWTMLRHDYDHNVPSTWIGMPLAAFASILFGEIGFMMSGYSINPESFADTFYVVLASFFILSMVLMATFMFDKIGTLRSDFLPDTSGNKSREISCKSA